MNTFKCVFSSNADIDCLGAQHQVTVEDECPTGCGLIESCSECLVNNDRNCKWYVFRNYNK